MSSIKDFFSSSRNRAILCVAAAAAITLPAAWVFLAMHEGEPIVSGPGVSQQRMLSDYAPAMAGTEADTPVYILEGEEPGGTFLILGGTHPQEVSGLWGRCY